MKKDKTAKNHRRPRVCDLFAGAGGFSEGFRQAGFDVVVANEYDKAAAETYRRNHPGTLLIEGDVTLPETKLAICQACARLKVDVVIGGPSCQSWSLAGKGGGFQDERGLAFFSFLELVQRIKPRLVVCENVPGLLRHPEAIKTILSIINHLGYAAEHKILNSADYGVCQVRRRLFLVATRIDWRNGPVIWPEPRFAPTNEEVTP